MAHHPEPLPPPPRRRRRRRWGRRLLIGIAVLIVVLLVTVQIVLWSPLPKEIAEAQVQKELGAAAKIESVSVGWFGTTRAHNVSLTLPMGRAPLVEARELVIRHDFLPLMAFTQNVKSITANGLKLDLHQDREGKWNAQHLIENRPDDDDPDPPGSILDLPDLAANDVTVKLHLHDGRSAELQDVRLNGIRKPPLDYEISLDAGPELSAHGRMALTRDASHEITVKLTKVPDVLRPLFGDLPEPLHTKLNWTGRRTPSGFDGMLQLADTAVGQVRASGNVELFTWENRLVAAPKGLTVQLVDPPSTQPATKTTAPSTQPSRQVVMDGGRILFGPSFALQRLRMKYKNGRFALDGAVDRRNSTAELTAAWDEIAEAGLGLTGEAKIKIRRELTGQYQGTADVEGSVTAGPGIARGKVFITAGGDSLTTLFSDIKTEAITWSSPDGRQFALPGLDMAIRSDGKNVRLQSLTLHDPSLGSVEARGTYNIADKNWFATVNTRELRLADLRVPGVRKPVDLDLDAFGTTERLDVKHFYFRHGGAMYWTQGFFDSRIPDPVKFKLFAWYTPARVQIDQTGFEGLRFQGEIEGTLNPRNLSASGSLLANNLRTRKRYIGDISAFVKANFQDDRMTIDSPNDIELLGGKWKLHGEWKKGADNRKQPLVVRVNWRDLPVGALCDAADVEGFGGTIDSGSANLTISGPTIRDINGTAEAAGSNLEVRSGSDNADESGRRHTTIAAADTIKVTAKLDAGDVTADVRLTNGKGTITSKVTTNITQPTPITVASTLKDWPAARAEQFIDPATDAATSFELSKRFKDLAAFISGQVDVKVVPQIKTVSADVKLNGRIERETGKTGDFELAGSSHNRKLTLSALKLRTLDGTTNASGEVDLDNINGSNFDAEYQKLDLTQLAWLVPQLKDFAGRFSGELRIHPSTDRRALGPIGIHFLAKPEGGRYRTIKIGEVEMTGFASYEGPKDFRIVSDNAIIHIADGKVLPFVRLSSTNTQGLTQLINLDLQGLNLEPIVHAFAKERKPMPGQVDGQVRLYGLLRNISTLNGEANIQLSRSDLVNYKPVAYLYNLMRVGREGNKPNGTGRLIFRVEQARATVTAARYFNRGIEINSFGQINELEKLENATMKVMLVGSAQPLRNIELPFFSDADKILGILQSTVTTVETTGTIAEPTPKQVFISEFNDTLRGLLLGVVKDEQEQ